MDHRLNALVGFAGACAAKLILIELKEEIFDKKAPFAHFECNLASNNVPLSGGSHVQQRPLMTLPICVLSVCVWLPGGSFWDEKRGPR
jgi:hypothetical protein